MEIDVAGELARWRESLMTKIPVGGLIARNRIAYKWKSPFRAWMLREAVAWRLVDLLSQSQSLHELGHILGSRILLRSGFESLATLIYLNQIVRQVVDGSLDFDEFGEKTTVLLFGARNNPDAPKSINVITVLKKCEKEYPGLEALYADLSESAHPSYEGMLRGYSTIDRGEYETHFANFWLERYGYQHSSHITLCMEIFLYEYNELWPELMTKLEDWIEANNERLEAVKQ